MIVDDIINVNDWVNEADDKKLNQDVEQNYNEVASEIIRAENPDLLSLILEKTTAQKEHESKQLAEKIQPGLDGFLRDDNETDDSSFKRRRSKCLAELNKKFSSTKTKAKSVRP